MRFLLAAGAMLAVLAGGAGAQEPHPLLFSGKIDPRVLADSRGGHAAHFIVALRDRANVTTTTADTARSRVALGRFVVSSLRSTANTLQAPLRAELSRLRVPFRSFWIANAIAVTAGRSVVEAIAARRDVERIEADRAFRGLESTTGKAASSRGTGVEWNVSQIGAPALWQRGFTGQGAVYANADTGVDWTHPALKTHYRGWNGTSATHDFNWHDAIHSDISGNHSNPCGFDAQAPCDDNLHGTHTMGTAVGDDGAGNQIGVAPGAKWISCRNMDEGVGRPSTYIECLQFFAAPTNLSGGGANPDLRPDAVGNSYACPPEEQCAAASLQAAVDNMRALGIFMSVSAENGGPSCRTVSDPPAIYDSSITIGATDSSDSIASFSSRGPVTVDGSNRPKPDLVAPGVAVRSSVPGGAYRSLNGTSMASPHVAAAVALLWTAVPSLRRNVDGTEAILEQTALHETTAQGCGGEPSTQVPNDTYGWGRIDVLAAYNAASTPTAARTLTARDAAAVEGTARAGSAAVQVTLSGPSTSTVQVRYRTVDGTAKAGKDYVRTAGTLIFAAGQTARTPRIRLVADRKHEPTERFTVVLEIPVGATLGRSRATVTIKDDDPRR
jgi:subtilisin family serine protease